MQPSENERRERIIYSNLPLAIYREVAAHLRQVSGIKTELLAQESRQFNYNSSQVGGLCIEYPVSLSELDRDRIASILNYYADRHGSYQRQDNL
jgi:hypothetical protein